MFSRFSSPQKNKETSEKHLRKDLCLSKDNLIKKELSIEIQQLIVTVCMIVLAISFEEMRVLLGFVLNFKVLANVFRDSMWVPFLFYLLKIRKKAPSKRILQNQYPSLLLKS